MKYQISCIGKLNKIDENKIIQKYLKRVKKKIQIIEYPQSSIEKEGLKIFDSSPKDSSLILLDKDGTILSTEELMELIKSYQMNNFKTLNFAIGGPLGHGQFIKQKASNIISFGRMTWSHIIARLMLVEQLYRIECMFNNHPYHK
tara:strand:- start:1969 stop:2403 length:435 start_codon:yes stop_codon:yes gene_type:complete